MKFEELIRKALKAAGLDEKFVTQINVESEGEIEKAVSDFAFSRRVESEVDRRIKKALDTREENLRAEIRKDYEAELEKLKGGKEKESTSQTTEGQNVDIEAIVKAAVKEATDPLNAELQTLKSDRVGELRSRKIKQALKDAGVPENMEQFISVDDDSKIAEAVEGVKTMYAEIRKSAVDEHINNVGQPGRGTIDEDTSEQLAREIADGLTEDSMDNSGVTGKFSQESINDD